MVVWHCWKYFSLLAGHVSFQISTLQIIRYLGFLPKTQSTSIPEVLNGFCNTLCGDCQITRPFSSFLKLREYWSKKQRLYSVDSWFKGFWKQTGPVLKSGLCSDNTSEQIVKLAGHLRNLVAQCLMANCYFQH